MASKRSVSSSTRNFRKLFEITEQLGLIDSSINYKSIVQKKTERWSFLLDIWQKNKGRVGRNIFLNPLSHIFYDEYRSHKRKKMIQLFQEIENVLINDNEAFAVWVQSDALKEELSKTVFRRPRDFLGRFQVAQGRLRLYSNKKNTAQPERTRRKALFDLRRAIDLSEDRTFCGEFKKTMKKILLESASWTDPQWVNYEVVSERIYVNYGVDYSHDEESFESLIKLLRYVYLNEPLTPNDILFADLNYALVKAIFGKHTDYMIYMLFTDAEKLLSSPGAKKCLRDSWMYTILSKWAYDQKHKYYAEARKIVLDLSVIVS